MAFTVFEELWFGESPDSDAERAAAESLAAQASRILVLRPFPASAQKLLALTNDPDSSVKQMQQVIETDPSLAMRVLRMVNSAAFGLRARCTSVPHAIVLLGRRVLGELAIALSVLEMFKAGTGPHQLWLRQHSSAVAGIARQLAMVLALPAADLLTIGLLHDIGKMFELQLGDDDYPDLLDQAGGERDAVHLLERTHHGYDHAVLAAHVLKGWKIPEPVPTLVAWHHQASRAFKAGGDLARQTSLIRLADQLSYAFEETAGQDEEMYGRIAEDEAATYLGLSASKLIEIWTELRSVSVDSQGLFAA